MFSSGSAAQPGAAKQQSAPRQQRHGQIEPGGEKMVGDESQHANAGAQYRPPQAMPQAGQHIHEHEQAGPEHGDGAGPVHDESRHHDAEGDGQREEDLTVGGDPDARVRERGPLNLNF